MKRLFSVIVLAAVLVAPIAVNAQTVDKDWVILTIPTSDPAISVYWREATGEGASGTLFEFTHDVNAGIFDHKPAEKKGRLWFVSFPGQILLQVRSQAGLHCDKG